MKPYVLPNIRLIWNDQRMHKQNKIVSKPWETLKIIKPINTNFMNEIIEVLDFLFAFHYKPLKKYMSK